METNSLTIDYTLFSSTGKNNSNNSNIIIIVVKKRHHYDIVKKKPIIFIIIIKNKGIHLVRVRLAVCKGKCASP